MEHLITPVDEGWSEPGTAEPAIAAWETETGLALPADYRRFLLVFDGGRPCPKTFRHGWSEDGAIHTTESYLEPFYAWQRVISWSAELGSRLPPQTLSIGADPGLIELLLSLRPQDHGTVYSWVRNWGDFGPDNDWLWRQAGSFTEFVHALYDSGGDLDSWRLPGLVKLERKLAF